MAIQTNTSPNWLSIKNWSEFQHYKDRNPPWIKLHRALLDDYAFAALPDANKAHLVLIWLFASQRDGRVPADASFLSRKLGTTEPIDLETLINAGFLIPEQVASKPLAPREQDATVAQAFARSQEKRREEKNSCSVSPHCEPGRNEPEGFLESWDAYPKREGGNSRKEAMKAYRARLKSGDSPADLLAGVKRYAAYIRGTGKEGTAYVKQAATFFGPGDHWREDWVLPADASDAGGNARPPSAADVIFAGAV